MAIGLSGLCGSAARAAGSLETGYDLALAPDGSSAASEVWTLLTGPDGSMQGVLTYALTYEMQSGKMVYTGHSLDLYARDGSFVKTVSTDSSNGYPSFVAASGNVVNGNDYSGIDVYVGHSDRTGDSIDRVVGGLGASTGADEKVMTLRGNWAMSFAPDGSAYAMYNDGANKIARVNLQAGTAQTVVATGGYSGGFDLAPNGDLYFSTYWMDPARPDEVLRLTAGQLAGALPLDLSAAQVVAQLPAGMGGGPVAVDKAGDVVFAMNDMTTYSSGLLACIYAGKDYSGLPTGYDVLAAGNTWLWQVDTAGDVSQSGSVSLDDAAFVSGDGTPISYVPEPVSALLLAGLGLAGVLRRRRRR
jgi:MYXO-CTERM domain-containing protein